MEKAPSEPRTKVATSSVWKRSKHYRDVKELLLLHRRYEVNALRALKRSTTSLDEDNEKRRMRTARTTSAGGIDGETSVSSDAKNGSPSRIRKKAAKNDRVVDGEYLSQIMSGIDRSRGLQLATTPPRPHALRLPKLDCIPQGSKAIFYTSLPSIPALPRSKEPKSSPRSVKRINRTSHKSDAQQYSLPEGCLTVRQLPSDHSMLRDAGAIESVTPLANNSSPTDGNLALPMTNPADVISAAGSHTTANEALYWLVPVLDEPSFRLRNATGKIGVSTDKNSAKDREKKLGASEETATPKYKRNVHFSEFLHEVHLYTPLSTKHESRA